jgi:hypothetical protein
MGVYFRVSTTQLEDIQAVLFAHGAQIFDPVGGLLLKDVTIRKKKRTKFYHPQLTAVPAAFSRASNRRPIMYTIAPFASKP